MKLTFSDPNAPQPERPKRDELKASPRKRPRSFWHRARVRLALKLLERLIAPNNDGLPGTVRWHEREAQRLLYLRHRYRHGDLGGAADQAAVVPAIPALEPASVLGYCRACGDALTTRADLCGRCAGLTTQNTESGQ